MNISIALIYQDLLGTYGDRGNALALKHRLKLRGFDSEILDIKPGEPIPKSCDIYFLGGGEDKAQTLATNFLEKYKKEFQSACESSLLVAICAGFQILGKQFPIGQGKLHPGLDLIDATTIPGTPRIIGEIVTQCIEPKIGLLTGFENHGGRTRLGNNNEALGSVLKGLGNGIDSQSSYVDGYFSEHIICSYLHGPILARNPKLNDYLISKITGLNLDKIDSIAFDTAEALHEERITANK